jgi:hypothetical protein
VGQTGQWPRASEADRSGSTAGARLRGNLGGRIPSGWLGLGLVCLKRSRLIQDRRLRSDDQPWSALPSRQRRHHPCLWWSSTRDEGADTGTPGVLRRREGLRESQGRCGEHGGGHGTSVEAPEGGDPWQDGSAAALPLSNEQLCATESGENRNKGWGRLVTSRGVSGSLERR